MSTGGATYLTFGQLARRLPAPSGRPISPTTVFRWATRGIRGRRLPTVVVGGRRLVEWEAYKAFAAELQAAGLVSRHPQARVMKATTRFRDAEKLLSEKGI